MGDHLGRGIFAVLAAVAVTSVVFRASAAEVRAVADDVDEVEVTEVEVIGATDDYFADASNGYFAVPEVAQPTAGYFADMGHRLGAAAGRQVELLVKLPTNVANGLFVDLPRKSGAFQAMTNIKDPRTVAIALTTDCDSLGTYVSGLLHKIA